MKDRRIGKEGFTRKEEIVEILSKYEPKELFGYPNNGGGVVHYDAIPALEMAVIMDHLPDTNKNDTQNNSPSFAEFVKVGLHYDGQMWFHGYRVLLGREDERITIEGYYAHQDVANAILSELVIKQDTIDEYGLYRHATLGEVYRAWWD